MSHGNSLIFKTNHSYCNISITFSQIVKIQYSKNIQSSLYHHQPFIFKSIHSILLLNKIPPPPLNFHPLSTLFIYFIKFSVNSKLCENTVLELSLFPIFPQ